MSDRRRFGWKSGRLLGFPTLGFWGPSLSVRDPQIPNLPLETPSGGAGENLDFTLDTAGAITIAGQAVTASVSQSLTNGALAIAGQTVTAGIGQSLGAGAVTLAGQSLSAGIGIEIGAGFGGPDIEGGELTPSVSQAIGNGALSLTGGDLTASFAVSLSSPASVRSICSARGQSFIWM